MSRERKVFGPLALVLIYSMISSLYNPSSGQVSGGTNNINYVNSQTIQSSGKKIEAALLNLPKNELAQTITFLDGLGRPCQTVAREASPSGHDLIQPVEYDSRGRVARSYLPYESATNNGQYQNTAAASQPQFYSQPGDEIANDSAPYAQTVFDNVPGIRVLEQGAPGSVWQPGGSTPHTIRTLQRSNEAV